MPVKNTKKIEPEHRMSNLPMFLSKIQDALDTQIIALKNKTILVIRELDVALMLAVQNKVIYVTDDAKCAEIFRKNTDAGMGNDDTVILINKWINKLKFKAVFEKMEKKIGKKKFDAVIMNPPYDRNLHLKILETVIPHAEKVINISPVRWLQDPFAAYSTRSDYCKFENSISKKIETLDVIPAKDASKLFDATFVMNLGIYVCSDKGGYAYQHNDPLVTKIVEKTMENSWAPYSQKKFYDEGCIQKKPYCLNLCGFGGSGKAELDIITCKSYQEQINTQLTNKKSVYTGGVGVSSTHFEFDTDTERRNFYNCYNHEFMKWTYRIWKSDVNVKAWKVPYFHDYTHPWTLKHFFAWFELTKAEQSRVIREIRQMRHDKRQ